MRITRFVFLMLTTSLATYWMNEAILAGEFSWAIVYGFFVLRNLRVSYQVSKMVRFFDMINKSNKKK